MIQIDKKFDGSYEITAAHTSYLVYPGKVGAELCEEVLRLREQHAKALDYAKQYFNEGVEAFGSDEPCPYSSETFECLIYTWGWLRTDNIHCIVEQDKTIAGLKNQVNTLTSLLDTEKRKNLRLVGAFHDARALHDFRVFVMECVENIFGGQGDHKMLLNTKLREYLKQREKKVENFNVEPVTEQKPGKRRVRLLRQDKVCRVAQRRVGTNDVALGTLGTCLAMCLANTSQFWIKFDDGREQWVHESNLIFGLPGTDLGKNPTRMLRGRTDG